MLKDLRHDALATLRTARYFHERAARADLETFDRLLGTAGDEPPRRGDEILPVENGCSSAESVQEKDFSMFLGGPPIV